jgi:hypothetical protein
MLQKKESSKRQALKEINGNRVVDTNIIDFKNLELKKEPPFAENRDQLRQEVMASRMIIIKQQNEINSLQKQVAFLKLSTGKERAVSPDQNVTSSSNVNYATPKKRRLDNTDTPSSEIPKDENDTRTPNVCDSCSKVESKKPLLSLFPPKPLSAKRYHREVLEDSPPKRPSSSSEQTLHFAHFNKLLDDLQADANSSPEIKRHGTSSKAASYPSVQRISPKPNVSPSVCVDRSPSNDDSSVYSPYSMGKKNMFLSNITRQYGPVSMTGLPAYKEKITSWKSKYYNSSN